MIFNSCSYLVNVVHGEDVVGILSRSRNFRDGVHRAAVNVIHTAGGSAGTITRLQQAVYLGIVFACANALPRQDATELTVRERASVIDSLLFAFIVVPS